MKFSLYLLQMWYMLYIVEIGNVVTFVVNLTFIDQGLLYMCKQLLFWKHRPVYIITLMLGKNSNGAKL